MLLPLILIQYYPRTLTGWLVGASFYWLSRQSATSLGTRCKLQKCSCSLQLNDVFWRAFWPQRAFYAPRGRDDPRPLIHHSLWDGRKKKFSLWFASDNADQIFMPGSFLTKRYKVDEEKNEAGLKSKMAATWGRSSPDVFWAEPKLSKKMPSWAWPSKIIANEPNSNLNF